MRVGPGTVGGLGGLGLLIVIVVALSLGVDPVTLLQEVPMDDSTVRYEVDRQAPPGGDEAADFVSVVLADTEDTWNQLFTGANLSYREPDLVLFSGSVRSACGFAQAAVGPFYCPGDQKVYLDLTFFSDLRNRFGAPGDFAQAYVIAHEVGHHVQTLLGISEEVKRLQGTRGSARANALSVRFELQADCFAGVWAHHADRARSILEEGDVEEALNAASAIGDDRIQKQTQGYVLPDSFTHGTSRQRAYWFRQGLRTGDLQACDTFSSQEP